MKVEPKGILRLGYVRVSLERADIGPARHFYADVLGLVIAPGSTDDRLLFRCWHEPHAFSFVIERGQARELLEIGFEMTSVAELESVAVRASKAGASLEPAASGAALPGIGASQLCTVPGGLRLRLYVSTTQEPEYMMGHAAPDWVTPRRLRATPAPLFLNHVGVVVTEPKRTADFLRQVLGFGMSECIGDPDNKLASALLFRMSKDVGGQEIALFRGPRFGLHHVAFTKEDPCDILIDGQFLAEARVRLDALGPHRQSYGKTFSLYFYDPAGLRLELCAGGRVTEVHPEFEPVVWDETSLHKALTFYDEQVPDGLLEACF